MDRDPPPAGGLSAKIVMRFGNRGPVVAGLGMVAVSLSLLARAPTDARFARDVLPAFVLQGLGAGVALGLAVIAAARTSALAAAGARQVEALNGGYHAASWVRAAFRGRGSARRGRIAGRPGEVMQPVAAHE